MEKSESIKNLAIALIKFNGLMGTIKKDTTNPFFKKKYAALPDILTAINKPLIESGLTINQFPTGQNGLTTILMHESGEYMMDSYIMTPTKNDPQGLGSSITYQRRYAVGAILSLTIDEDDDGNGASVPAKTVAEPTTKQKVDTMLKTKAVDPFTEAVLTDVTKEAIAKATDTKVLTDIWNKNKELQINDDFIELIKKRRAELTAK